MKDSILHVPLAGDFIDLEHLIYMGKPSFSSMNESISIELKYLLQKENVVVGVKVFSLFTPEEAEQYSGYKFTNPPFEAIGNAAGEKLKTDALEKFEEKVRIPIYNAWRDYRESKK